jgi:hypothetical protein
MLTLILFLYMIKVKGKFYDKVSNQLNVFKIVSKLAKNRS